MNRTPPARPTGAELLAAAARARLEAAREGLGTGPVYWGLGVAVVVGDLDPTSFAGGVVDFTRTIPPELRDGWYRTFTRTVFLAGDPAGAAARHPPRHTTAQGDLAWYGPARRGALGPLSRLLRAFQGPAPIETPAGPLTVTVPGTPSGHTIDATVATGGVTTGEYLVHVHHLIAEATLRELIGPGDTLRLNHRETLHAEEFRGVLDPLRAGSVQARITRDGSDGDRLRLYGVLTSNRQGGH
ncbi:hypothetical protein GCM10010387_50700 [Streptomyces inusitatus]|uniref:Uncharacterized protein n=1 Tax=Streptomyces inusitatus TaxID=68221 RepID=A0A918QHM0_9ACTN|nr:DUF6182 family protein [Streptomyces inusitatus]GGZ50209.1 hypothetical protein GCM10010387_50700 [Streptomyces inusitatus]